MPSSKPCDSTIVIWRSSSSTDGHHWAQIYAMNLFEACILMACFFGEGITSIDVMSQVDLQGKCSVCIRRLTRIPKQDLLVMGNMLFSITSLRGESCSSDKGETTGCCLFLTYPYLFLVIGVNIYKNDFI